MRPSRCRLVTVLMLLVWALVSSAGAEEVREGILNGAYYKLVVPENWNGILLVYARGYTTEVPPPSHIFDGLEELFTSQGYALAGSLYRAGGWAVKEGSQDTLAVTELFKEEFGPPQYTILVGSSMGSVIALKIIEEDHGIYDGAVALCGFNGGTTKEFDFILATAQAYATVWGWPDAWGTVDDVRDDISFDHDVAPVIFPQLLLLDLGDPIATAKFEFVRLVTKNPLTGYYESEGFLTQLFFATQARGEMERRAGGPVAQNLGFGGEGFSNVYTLTNSDRAYLQSFGLSQDEIDAWMEELNTTRIEASRTSRQYAKRYADPEGKFVRPVLTLHTQFDALAPPQHESAYLELVAKRGKTGLLWQVYTGSIGHCHFTQTQLSRAVDGMVHWLDSGQRPEGEAFFPTAEGFLPPTFIPGPWLWPLEEHP